MPLPKTKQDEQAHEVKNGYLKKVSAIQNDNRLTAEGKRGQIAKLHVTANQQLTRLKRERNEQRTTRQAELERGLFGLPATAGTSDTVSYRDALDRVGRAASAKDDRELQQLYDNAKLSGDTILTKAILGHAFRAGHVEVINRYLNEPGNDVHDAKANELWHLMRGDDGATDQAQNAVNEWAYNLDKPTEIRAYSTSTIEQMAQAAD